MRVFIDQSKQCVYLLTNQNNACFIDQSKQCVDLLTNQNNNFYNPNWHKFLSTALKI